MTDDIPRAEQVLPPTPPRWPDGASLLGELHRDHVYAVGLPDGATVQDHLEQLRQVQEWTGARLVVHAPGVTLTELTDTALRDAELALHHLRCAIREHEQRATLLHRQVADLTRGRDEAVEQLDAVRAAPTVRRHADGSLSVDWPEGAVSCLMTREVLDGILLERATLRDQVDQLRGLLGEALSPFVWHEAGHPGRPCVRTGWVDIDTIARWRREANAETGTVR